jgi:serine O-acetyltransferase
MINNVDREISQENSLKILFQDIQADIDRYAAFSQRNWLMRILTTKGLWVTVQYRISRWIHFNCHWPLLRPILKAIGFISQKLVEITTGAEVPNRAIIGKGILIPHTNGIVIHIDAVIGETCNIGHQVTIGVGGRGEERGTPHIGDRVFIAPGAKLFGPITIGNDVAIGANAVVNRSLPDSAVAVGIPAKVISYRGSQDYIA